MNPKKRLLKKWLSKLFSRKKSAVSAKPVVSAKSVVSAGPVVSAKSVVSSEPVVSAKPVVPAKSVVSSEPVVSAKSVVSAGPVVSAKSVVSSEPVVSAKSVVSSEPVVSARPVIPALSGNPEFLSKLFSKDLIFLKKLSSILVKIFEHKRGRYFIFLSFSGLISLSLFYFMAMLISGGETAQKVSDQEIHIEFLLNADGDELELRSRRLIKKPEEPKPMKIPKLKIQPAEIKKPDLSLHLPQLELAKAKEGAYALSSGSQDREASPIFRIQPIYPRKAALQNIEGFVVLKFDITKTGQVDNISVLQASPPQIFNSSAIQALRKWKYKAKIENGKPVRQKNLKTQLDFELTQ